MYAENQTKWLSASWANHCEYQPNQTSDSDLTYNNTLQLQEANVEVVIHNVDGDEKIDIIMTMAMKPQ